MNKAKQEAERLYEKYEKLFPPNYDKSGHNFNHESIKQCALICVDEMKKENIKRGQPTADLDQVKQAITEL